MSNSRNTHVYCNSFLRPCDACVFRHIRTPLLAGLRYCTHLVTWCCLRPPFLTAQPVSDFQTISVRRTTDWHNGLISCCNALWRLIVWFNTNYCVIICDEIVGSPRLRQKARVIKNSAPSKANEDACYFCASCVTMWCTWLVLRGTVSTLVA